MKVFNLYLKILKKNLPSVIIYFFVFIGVAIMFTQSAQPTTNDFTESKVAISIRSDDEDTLLIENLLIAMSKYAYSVEVDEADIADAIYYREIMFAFHIPANFTNDFYNGLNPQISHLKVADSGANISLESVINQYFNLVKTYKSQLSEMSEEEMFLKIQEDLGASIDVTKIYEENNQKEMARYYYNYMNYVLFALLLSVVGLITIKIRQFEVKKRMAVSAYSQTRITLEILLGHFLFAMVVTTVLVAISFILFPVGMKDPSSKLYILNAYILTLAVLSISYFISLFSKNEEVISALTNIVSLGSSFLGGAFVPQFLLSDGVIKASHLLPTYYFININDRIASSEVLNQSNLNTIYLYLGIQVLFFIVFALLSVFITYKQSRQEQ